MLKARIIPCLDVKNGRTVKGITFVDLADAADPVEQRRGYADGTRAGFDIELTRAGASAVPIRVIASGGVGTLDHLAAGIRDGHASAVLAASIFHFGLFTIAQAKAHLKAAGIPIRM